MSATMYAVKNGALTALAGSGLLVFGMRATIAEDNPDVDPPRGPPRKGSISRGISPDRQPGAHGSEPCPPRWAADGFELKANLRRLPDGSMVAGGTQGEVAFAKGTRPKTYAVVLKSTMRLAESYLAYLQAPDLRPAAGALVEPLQSGGHDLDAQLMRRFAAVGPGESRIELPGSPWHGLRVHIGGALPAEVDAGDVWFDVYELAPMILLPRPPPDEDVPPEVGARLGRFVAWMALRPVAIWQFRAFLELASFESRPVQIAPPFPLLDKERILAGAETDPVTRVTCGEAELYTKWFGKGLCDQGDWQAASRFVPAEAMTSLWGLLRREWAGRCGFDESSRIVVNPQSFQLDPQDEADRDEPPPPDLRLLYDEWAKPKGVGFRTHVSTQIGLLRAGGPDPFTFDNVYLRASLRRSG